jgi:tetratricopeptide (TPR) repeat protein
MTREGDRLANLALVSHQSGRHEEARRLYERALETGTKHRSYVLVNLGFLELARGKSTRAMERASDAISIKRSFTQAYELKASAALDLGHKRVALETWRDCLEECQDELSMAERADVCAAICCMATELGEREAGWIHTSAIRAKDLTAKGLKNFIWALILQDELTLVDRVIKNKADGRLEPFDLIVIGFALRARSRGQAKLSAVLSESELVGLKELAESKRWEVPLALARAGSVIKRHDLVIEIVEFIGGAASYIFEWLGLAADAYYSEGRLEDAVRILEMVQRHPEFDDNRTDHQRYELDLARCMLALGDMSPESWALYERRIDVVFQERYTLSAGRLYPDLPRWSPNESLHHVLLTHEQGLGDQILFTTLIPAFRKSFPALEVSLEVHPKLGAWTRKRFGDIQVYTTGQSIPREKATFDSVLFLGSIAQYIKPVDLQIHLSSLQAARIDRHHKNDTAKPRIGIYWRSSDSSLSDAKSMSLSLLEPLKGLEVDWVCLQDRLSHSEYQKARDWPMNIPNFDLREDLESLESLMQSLNGVVTISTTVAHMACAMGLPTWVMLSEKEGKKLWCWGDTEADCRFYGSAHLVRGLATSPHQVVATVLADLKKYLTEQ